MKSDWHKIFSIVIFTLGVAFRFVDLGGQSLWQDEAHTWLVSQLPLDRIPDVLLLNGVHPPLYFMSVKLVIRSFGESEAALRSLSIAADILAMLMLAGLGHRLGGRLGQVATLFFWAFHPMAIWFSREARPYALASSFTVILIWIYLRFDAQRDLRSGLLAVGTIALGSLTHYFFFVPFIALIGLAFTEIRDRPKHFRYWTLISITGLIPLAGWLLLFFNQAVPSIGIGWIRQPEIGDLLATIWNLLSGYGGRSSLATTAFGLSTLSLIGAGLIFSNGHLHIRRLFFIAVPSSLLAVWILSQRRPVYMDRYFIVLLPICALTAGAGASAIRQRFFTSLPSRVPRLLAGSLIAVAMIFGLWSALGVHTNPTYARENWRSLIAYLEAANQPKQLVFLQDPESVMLLEYYAVQNLALGDGLSHEDCGDSCWWILRQPYTYTHAFTLSVTDPNDPWVPKIPEACSLRDSWRESPGIALWQLDCRPVNS